MAKSYSVLRIHLVLLVLLAILPALGLALYSGLEQRRLAAAAAHQEALRLARLTANKQNTHVEGAHQLLVALSQLPAVANGDPAACASLLLTLMPARPLYANLGVIDVSGNLICSALPFDGPLDLSDRAYFRRAVATGDFAIGDYQVGRVTGIASLNVGYPIRDAQDNVQRVIYAALDLAWMNELAADSQLPPGSVISALDQTGTILVHYPNPERWLGQSVPQAPIVQHILTHQGENTVEAAGVDGVLRLYAFTPLSPTLGSPAYVNVGIPTTVAYAEANRSLSRNLTLLGLAALFALAATHLFGQRFIVRPVQTLLRVTQQLAAGDLSTRSRLTNRLGELGQLAHAFDDMASSLQQQTAERRRAEELMGQQAAALEVLNQASRAFAETATDYQRLLDVVAQQFAAPLGDACLLFLVSEEKQRPAPVAHHDRDPEAMAPRAIAHIASLLRAGEHLYKHVLATGRPLLLAPSSLAEMQDAALAAESGLILDSLGATSLLLLPLQAHNQTVCLLYLWRYRQERPIYSQDDLNLAQDLAGQAALYVVYARLFDRAQRRLKRLRALHAIDRAITASLELPGVLDVVLEQVTTQLAVDAACILLFDEAGEMLVYAAGRGFRTDAIAQVRLRLGEGLPGRAALERRTLIIPDLSQAQEFVRAPLLAAEEFVAYYAVPLLAKDQIKGVLDVFHRAPLDAEPEWLAFLESLAVQAAIAVDNADGDGRRDRPPRRRRRRYPWRYRGNTRRTGHQNAPRSRPPL